MKLQIILGNQLFPLNFYDKNIQTYFMCEDVNLCTHYKYHKHKIIFFLSSMRKYAAKLEEHAKMFTIIKYLNKLTTLFS